MAILGWVTSFLLLSACVLAAQIQHPLVDSSETSPQGSQHRTLHGRFLQVTGKLGPFPRQTGELQ
jgi:hypothetical protein